MLYFHINKKLYFSKHNLNQIAKRYLNVPLCCVLFWVDWITLPSRGMFIISSGGLSGINYPSIFLNVLLCAWLDLDLLVILKTILWVKVNLKRLMSSSYLELLSVRILLLILILIQFLKRFLNYLVSLLDALRICPLTLCWISIKRSYCLILSIVHVFGLLIKEITWIG